MENAATGISSITTAFSTAVGAMADNIVALVAGTLPTVAPIAGLGIALSFSWSLIRRFIR